MELKMVDGNYVKNAYHDLASVSGTEELSQRIMMRLKARRGGFALLPDYGSRLYTLAGARPAERESLARQYIAEALSGENVLLEALQIHDKGDTLTLELTLRCSGQSLNIKTEI